MTRKLPLVDLQGTAFFVDVLSDHLMERDNLKNRIPFEAFQQEGNGYKILYDLERKNIAQNPTEITDFGGRYQWVTLQALMELDPEGIAMKYDIPIQVLCPDLSDLTDGFEEDIDTGDYF